MKHRMLVAVLALPFMLPAPAAFAHEGDANVIHACVHRVVGDVRFVAPDESCRPPEVAVHLPGQGTTGSGGFRGVRLFTSNGSFTVPAGVTSVLVELWGAGGGSGLRRGASSGGGGAGAYLRTALSVVPGQVVSVTIGQGGTSACDMNGSAGGDTSFGTDAIAGGGGGGTAGGPGGAGGSPTAGGSADPDGIAVDGQPGTTFGAGGQSAQGSFASPGGNPGRGGGSILAPGTQNCSLFEEQFATGQPGQLIVQW